MNEYHFRTAGALRVCFRTAHNLERDAHALLQFGAYVPGFEMMAETPGHVDLTLEHIVGQADTFEDQGDHLILTSKQSDGIPADIYHVLYGAVRKQLLEKKNLCSIHATCVGAVHDFRLVVGHSGSGKTTLSQRLIDEHDMTLFSGNKTVLQFSADGTMKALGGTRTMTAVDKNLQRYAYELTPEHYAAEKEVLIKGIDIIRVNDGVEECEALSPLSALHTLYPYFMDQVNADVIVCGGQLFDGGVSTDTKQDVVSGLSKALQNIPVRKISGAMHYMEEMIIS